MFEKIKKEFVSETLTADAWLKKQKVKLKTEWVKGVTVGFAVGVFSGFVFASFFIVYVG